MDPSIADNLKGANQGKVAVVTGIARGIGQAIAIALADSGADVAILDLNLESLEETKRKCEETREGVKVRSASCDVVNASLVSEVFTQIQADLGLISVLVNNAGVLFGRPASMITNFGVYWRAVEVNFKGPMACTLQVLNLNWMQRS